MKDISLTRRRFVETTVLSVCGFTLSESTTAASLSVPVGDITGFLPTLWKVNKEMTMAFANAMPEEHYGFKPTPEIWSYAEQMLHLAQANHFLLSRVKGEKPTLTQSDFAASGKSKTDVIKMLDQSFESGTAAVGALTPESANQDVPFGKSQVPKWKVVAFVCDHITHHRGQTVIYLRLKGIAPPEYQSGYFPS